MKRVFAMTLACMITFGVPAMTVSASSLDDLVNEQNQQTQQVEQVQSETQNVNVEPIQDSIPNQTYNTSATQGSNYDYIEEIKSANDLTELSPGASKINGGIKKFASFIIQVLSYGITALLAARVIIDLVYILIPFSRTLLANGYQGTPNMSADMQGGMGGMNGMGGMGGMGGYGMNRMGMGGMGGYGMNRMGMNGMGMNGMGMNGMGMNGMGMGGMQGGMNGMQGGVQGGAMSNRIQLVSTQALNAVASESVPGPDGITHTALRIYSKDMIVYLVAAPILVVLAVSGALTNLGLLLGELIANAISNAGSMI